jgi:hypothetical protein
MFLSILFKWSQIVIKWLIASVSIILYRRSRNIVDNTLFFIIFYFLFFKHCSITLENELFSDQVIFYIKSNFHKNPSLLIAHFEVFWYIFSPIKMLGK